MHDTNVKNVENKDFAVLKLEPPLTTFHAVTPVLLPTALAGSASEAIRTKLTTKPVVKIEKGEFSDPLHFRRQS